MSIKNRKPTTFQDILKEKLPAIIEDKKNEREETQKKIETIQNLFEEGALKTITPPKTTVNNTVPTTPKSTVKESTVDNNQGIIRSGSVKATLKAVTPPTNITMNRQENIKQIQSTPIQDSFVNRFSQKAVDYLGDETTRLNAVYKSLTGQNIPKPGMTQEERTQRSIDIGRYQAENRLPGMAIPDKVADTTTSAFRGFGNVLFQLISDDRKMMIEEDPVSVAYKQRRQEIKKDMTGVRKVSENTQEFIGNIVPAFLPGGVVTLATLRAGEAMDNSLNQGKTTTQALTYGTATGLGTYLLFGLGKAKAPTEFTGSAFKDGVNFVSGLLKQSAKTGAKGTTLYGVDTLLQKYVLKEEDKKLDAREALYSGMRAALTSLIIGGVTGTPKFVKGVMDARAGKVYESQVLQMRVDKEIESTLQKVEKLQGKGKATAIDNAIKNIDLTIKGLETMRDGGLGYKTLMGHKKMFGAEKEINAIIADVKILKTILATEKANIGKTPPPSKTPATAKQDPITEFTRLLTERVQGLEQPLAGAKVVPPTPPIESKLDKADLPPIQNLIGRKQPFDLPKGEGELVNPTVAKKETVESELTKPQQPQVTEQPQQQVQPTEKIQQPEQPTLPAKEEVAPEKQPEIKPEVKAETKPTPAKETTKPKKTQPQPKVEDKLTSIPTGTRIKSPRGSEYTIIDSVPGLDSDNNYRLQSADGKRTLPVKKEIVERDYKVIGGVDVDSGTPPVKYYDKNRNVITIGDLVEIPKANHYFYRKEYEGKQFEIRDIYYDGTKSTNVAWLLPTDKSSPFSYRIDALLGIIEKPVDKTKNDSNIINKEVHEDGYRKPTDTIETERVERDEQADTQTSIRNSKPDRDDRSKRPDRGRVQGTDEQIPQGRGEISDVDKDGIGGTVGTDVDRVPETKRDTVPETVIPERVERVDKERQNLRLKVEDDWLSGLAKNTSNYGVVRNRLAMNRKVLEILDKPDNQITNEDKQILKNYTGKGGLGETGREILTQYFTDYKTVDFIYDKILKMGFGLDGIKALDPSTGVGVFMGLAPDGVSFDAIDIDPISARISSILYPDSNVMNKGFEEHRVNNAYDLIITNVPFAQSRGAGLIKDKPHIKKLHDYFLMAAMDKAKDNGLIVTITPSSVMDSVDKGTRLEVSKNAEFIGAYRLPSSVFEKTGTDVSTDILFFRRRVRNSFDESVDFANNSLFEKVELIDKSFLDTEGGYRDKKGVENFQIPINSYYKENPSHILGERTRSTNRYGKDVLSVRGELDEKAISGALSDGLKYTPSAAKEDESSVVLVRPTLETYSPGKEDITPNGGLFLKDGKWSVRSDKKVDGVIQSQTYKIETTPEESKIITDMLKIASLSNSLRVKTRKGITDKDRTNLIKQLKKDVEQFKTTNKKIFSNAQFKGKVSSDPRYHIVKVLTENPDIFREDTLKVSEYKIPLEDTKNLDLLANHLLYKDNKITVENFASNYQGGISKEKARDILENSGEFFKLPSEYEKEIFDKFGKVTYIREKLREEQFARKTDYLTGNIYKKIDSAQQEVDKGNTEFKKNVSALKKVLPKPKTLNDTSISIRSKWMDLGVVEKFLNDYLSTEYNTTDISISYDAEKVNYSISWSMGGDYSKLRNLSIGKKAFSEWLPMYLNGKGIIIRSDGKKDIAASAKATQEMRKIDDVFNNYLKTNPEIANPIMDTYNRTSNNWVSKDYKKDELIIPGTGKGWKFRSNQTEFVNMAISLGSAVNAQRTGAGKTATNAAVNQMLKVTGMANKPISVVPGKVIKKFVRDVKHGSRGLSPIFPDMKILDVTEYKFDEAMAQIAFNNWDMILIPDTWFKRIRVTPERETAYIEKQIEILRNSLLAAKAEKGKGASTKDIENAIASLEATMAELTNYVKRDGIYFEDLGVDAISLDEAQSVKNLVSSAKGGKLGMSATPSQVALDFNMKAKYIMEKKNGKNIFLYTATPVSNSMLEIYGLLQNIAPQEWTSRGINSVDDFIDSFVDVSETIGITTSNEVGTINKVDGFINIDDLRSLFRKYVDYRPFIEGAVIPEVKDVRYTVELTDWQRTYFEDILERLVLIKSKEPRDYGDVTDGIMKVLGDARRASISPSLITGESPTLENSPKMAKAVEVIAKIYKDTSKNQVVFLDDYGDKVLKSKNLHNFIKDELSKAGVPAKEIVIVNGKTNSDVKQKLKIQDEFNDGKYKIIIGTTESIGAGMDLQEDTISMISLDIPYTPTSITQRRGRGERPGNINEFISNINIFTRGSYDAWSANIVAVKKRWQDQLLEGSNDAKGGYLKNKDDDSFDVNTIMSELIEDPLEKATLRQEGVEALISSEITSLNQSIKKVERTINELEEGISRRKNVIENASKKLLESPDSVSAQNSIERNTEVVKGMEQQLIEANKEKEILEDQVAHKKSELSESKESFKLESERLKTEKPIKNKKKEESIETLTKELRQRNIGKSKKTKPTKDIRSDLKESVDQRVKSDQRGAVRIAKDPDVLKEVFTPQETLESDRKVMERFKAARNPKVPLFDKVVEGLEFVHKNAFRGAFPELKRGPEHADLRAILLRHRAVKDISMTKTLKQIQGLVAGMTNKQYELYNIKVVFSDLRQEAIDGNKLPFGLKGLEQVERILANNEKVIAGDKIIGEAIQNRKRLQDALKNELITLFKDLGMDISERFSKEDYYRHLVIEKINTNNMVKGSGSKLKSDKSSGYMKQRKGSELDIISESIKADAEVLAQMYYDIEAAKLVKQIRDGKYNIRKSLDKKAKEMNNDAMESLYNAEATDPELGEVMFADKGRRDSPTEKQMKKYKQNVAMSFSKLSDMAKKGELWQGENNEYADLVEQLSSVSSTEKNPKMFRFISELAKNGNDEQVLSAKTILKYVQAQKQLIQQALGDNYSTWDKIIPEGYSTWNYNDGKLFYNVISIPDMLASTLLDGLAQTVNVKEQDLKKVLVQGSIDNDLVLPNEVAITLTENIQPKHFDSMLKKINLVWKQHQLMSPRRVFRYNIRNTTGDLDSIFGLLPGVLNPKQNYIGRAIKDLYKVFGQNKSMSPLLEEWFEQGGMSSFLQVQEIGDIDKLKIFLEQLQNRDFNFIKKYFRTVRTLTDYRESILRFAAYMYVKEQHAKGNMVVGGAQWDEVVSIKNPNMRAFWVSNKTIGDYSDMSPLTQRLSAEYVPFFRFTEQNLVRYFNVIRNGIHSDRYMTNLGEQILESGEIKFEFNKEKQMPRGKKNYGNVSRMILAKIGRMAFQLFAFQAAIRLWNHLLFKDDIKEKLSPQQKTRLYIYLGNDNDGNPVIFDRIGVLTDFLEWFGLGTVEDDLVQMVKGNRTLKEQALHMAKQPVNKLWNASIPLFKLPIELAQGRSTFPDPFNPRTIRNRGQYLARQFALGNEYDALMGMPAKSYGNTFLDFFLYRVDYRQSAYFDTLDAKRKFEVNVLGKADRKGFFPDNKANSIYYYKLALRYGDEKAAEKYLSEYVALGGTSESYKNSMATLSPTYGLGAYRQEFIDSLDGNQLAKYELAVQFFEDSVKSSQLMNGDFLFAELQYNELKNEHISKVNQAKEEAVQQIRKNVQPSEEVKLRLEQTATEAYNRAIDVLEDKNTALEDRQKIIDEVSKVPTPSKLNNLLNSIIRSTINE
jgi:hypothetical protein